MQLLEKLFSLEGKTALVTGGATGIGRMVTGALALAGADVLIASRKGEDCERVAEEINGRIEREAVSGFSGDVASDAGIARLYADVAKRTDRLHILVNNAGTSWGAPLDEFPYQAWKRVFDLNVTGLFELTRQLLPLLERDASAEDPARVINLGSVMGSIPMGDGAYSYAASKAAVHHLTRILAKELADRRITVNAFAPGPFPSKMTRHATGTDEKAAIVAKSVPLGRLGNADDIAAATLYLCGTGGAYVTGAVLPVDGGCHVMTGPSLFDEAAKI